jgi:hypothetical protein
VVSKPKTCSFDYEYECERTYVSMLTVTGNDPMSEMVRRGERYEMKEISYLAADLELAAGELRSVRGTSDVYFMHERTPPPA